MNEGKKWYKSKTLWANVIGMALVALKYFGLIGGAEIPDEYELGAMAGFVVEMILRVISSKKLTK